MKIGFDLVWLNEKNLLKIRTIFGESNQYANVEWIEEKTQGKNANQLKFFFNNFIHSLAIILNTFQ